MSLEEALLERIQRLSYELEFVRFLSEAQKLLLKKELEKLKEEIAKVRKYGA